MTLDQSDLNKLISVFGYPTGQRIFDALTMLAGGGVQSVNSGTDITVDNTNPQAPIVNYTGSAGGVQSVTGTPVDNTDPLNPIINASGIDDVLAQSQALTADRTIDLGTNKLMTTLGKVKILNNSINELTDNAKLVIQQDDEPIAALKIDTGTNSNDYALVRTNAGGNLIFKSFHNNSQDQGSIAVAGTGHNTYYLMSSEILSTSVAGDVVWGYGTDDPAAITQYAAIGAEVSDAASGGTSRLRFYNLIAGVTTEVLQLNGTGVVLPLIPEFADNTAAAAVLPVGAVYYTDVAGEHILKRVHA